MSEAHKEILSNTSATKTRIPGSAKVLAVLFLGLFVIVKDFYILSGFGASFQASTLLFFAPHVLMVSICIWLLRKQSKRVSLIFFVLLLVLFFWIQIYFTIGHFIDQSRRNSEARTVQISNIQDALLNSNAGNPVGITISYDVVTTEDKTLKGETFGDPYRVYATAIPAYNEKAFENQGFGLLSLSNTDQSATQSFTPPLFNGFTFKAGLKYHVVTNLRPDWLFNPGSCYRNPVQVDRSNELLEEKYNLLYGPKFTNFWVTVSMFNKDEIVMSKNQYNLKQFADSALKEGLQKCPE